MLCEYNKTNNVDINIEAKQDRGSIPRTSTKQRRHMIVFKLKEKPPTLWEKLGYLLNIIKQFICSHDQTSIDNGGIRFCIKCKKALYKTTY